MIKEESCGAVLFANTAEGIRYVLVQSKLGHWGFPKGHRESGESEAETALREIFEEVHVCATLMDGFTQVIKYSLPNGAEKQVTFFLASYHDQQIIPQLEELLDAGTFPLFEAIQLLEHDDSKTVLTNAHAFIECYLL